MKANMTQKILAGVAACAFSSSSLLATIAYDYPVGLAGNQPNGPFSFGNTFTLTDPIDVVGLGAFDSGGDGIGGSGVSVAIYSIQLDGSSISGGSLVVAPYTFAGTADPLLSDSSTRYHAMNGSVQLNPGTYMVVASHYGSGAGASEQNYNYVLDGSKVIVPSANNNWAMEFGRSYYSGDASSWGDSLPLGWSLGSSTYVPSFAAGNFDFTPVPEASSFAVAGVGLLGLVYVGRCVVQRRKTVA